MKRRSILPLTDLELNDIAAKVKGVTLDSRAVKKGYLFAALPGNKSDGRKYIGDAIRNGAIYVLAPSGTVLPEDATGAVLVTADNPRRSLSLMASRFYRQQPGRVVAVTGTNGKTSIVHFTRQLWEAAGFTAASLGTLGVQSGPFSRSGSLTTPDPVKLHAEMADLAAAGVTHLAMEASSHGLDQYRLDGVRIGAVGFTNLTRDHLDYHGTEENYFAAKKRLFSEILVDGGTAVLNADIPEFAELKEIVSRRGLRLIDYGRNASFLKVLSVTTQPRGYSMELEVSGRRVPLNVPLAGSFQTMNVLCALGLAMSGEPDNRDLEKTFFAAAETLKGAPGRLEFIGGHPKGAAIYVDYAHTPDALENVLKSLRPHTKSRLVCVAGCGGDRDPGKRPVMGRIGAELADEMIITDDNPRSEDPAMIRKAMLDAAPGAREIGDRAEAIRTAIRDLEEGDVLVIAGKGHEQGQIIGDRALPFDDVIEAKKAITELN